MPQRQLVDYAAKTDFYLCLCIRLGPSVLDRK